MLDIGRRWGVLPDMQAGDLQDAMEYFQHLLEYMSRCERSAAGRLGEPTTPADG